MLRYTIDHLEYVYINRAMNEKLICISYRRTKGSYLTLFDELYKRYIIPPSRSSSRWSVIFSRTLIIISYIFILF